MSDGDLKLAMCQIRTVEWDLDGNLERALDGLKEAKRLEADLAVFPECMLHAYPIGDAASRESVLARVRQAAEPLDGERVRRLQEAACRHGLPAVFGFAERGEQDRIYNTAVWLRADGTIGNVYRKVHCRPFESVWFYGGFTPGDEFSVFPFEYRGQRVTLGTMICFDRERPESWQCLRHLGAELILCPLATNTDQIARSDGRHNNENLTQALAATSETFIAVVNHAGRFNGGSFVVGPGGEVARQMGLEAGVDLVSLDLAALRRQRQEAPFGWRGYGFTRPEVYRRYLPERVANRS